MTAEQTITKKHNKFIPKYSSWVIITCYGQGLLAYTWSPLAAGFAADIGEAETWHWPGSSSHVDVHWGQVLLPVRNKNQKLRHMFES